MTEVDIKSQQVITEHLHSHYPGVPVVGEEGRESTLGASRRWLIDPIDGTRNYLNGRPDFAVTLAHQVRESNVWRTTDGVVSLPAHGTTYWPEFKRGAFKIDGTGVETRVLVPKSRALTLSGALVELSVRGLGQESELALISGLIDARAVRRTSGSAAMGIARVSGEGLQAALVTAKAYDVEAGLLVAEEAGAHTKRIDFVRDDRQFTLYVVA